MIACSHPKKNLDDGARMNENISAFADSLFFKDDNSTFQTSDCNKLINSQDQISLNQVTIQLKQQLTECLPENPQVTNVYYYQNLYSPKVDALVFLVSTLESNFFTLVTLSDNNDIISCLRLTEDSCDLVSQDDNKEEIWCDITSAFLINSQKLHLIKEHIEKSDFGDHVEYTKDSISKVYLITEIGNLAMVKSDSIRIEQNVNN
jgi:hypothetical protein